MLARMFSVLSILIVALAIFAISNHEDEPDPEKGRLLLERLSAGEVIPLNEEEFVGFQEICLVGWDRFPFPPPQNVRAICPRLRDHSAIGIKSDGTCEVIISASLRSEYLINFAMDGGFSCGLVPSDSQLIVYEGGENFRRRLDIAEID